MADSHSTLHTYYQGVVRGITSDFVKLKEEKSRIDDEQNLQSVAYSDSVNSLGTLVYDMWNIRDAESQNYDEIITQKDMEVRNWAEKCLMLEMDNCGFMDKIAQLKNELRHARNEINKDDDKRRNEMAYLENAVENSAPLSSTYNIEGALGQGNFGTVHLGRHKSTGELVAVKTIPTTDMHTLATEFKAMMKCSSPFVVQCLGIFQSEQRLSIHLTMEVMCKGSLDKLLAVTKMDEVEAATVLYPVVMGLRHLHLLGILHRDVKPGNILINRLGEVKLGDLGESYIMSDVADFPRGQAGDLVYSCPEVVTGKMHSYECDVWMVGTTFRKMLSGPHQIFNSRELIGMLVAGDFPELFHFPQSSEACKLLASCLQPLWSDRIANMDSILEHPFMALRAGPEMVLAFCERCIELG
ncbi:kinase-like protein [Rhizoclosmatium globosum]|uniref:mitogen-activated protein kinase kinase n=1 Tax=Rhizoclosmatium globosum TaxID=329046 RepID=A0A1Y2AZE4_9FUNG|nr:kinase-like protein [Rhizoclosmatium globosum]|eukprot:ORY27607.1 kinase-like protein [Rhizoclosmatium globosum]